MLEYLENLKSCFGLSTEILIFLQESATLFFASNLLLHPFKKPLLHLIQLIWLIFLTFVKNYLTNP